MYCVNDNIKPIEGDFTISIKWNIHIILNYVNHNACFSNYRILSEAQFYTHTQNKKNTHFKYFYIKIIAHLNAINITAVTDLA